MLPTNALAGIAVEVIVLLLIRWTDCVGVKFCNAIIHWMLNYSSSAKGVQIITKIVHTTAPEHKSTNHKVAQHFASGLGGLETTRTPLMISGRASTSTQSCVLGPRPPSVGWIISGAGPSSMKGPSSVPSTGASNWDSSSNLPSNWETSSTLCFCN